MAFVIIDLEFNNLRNITKYYPNFYEDNANMKDIRLDNEIIEIGAIKLDAYMKPLSEFKTFIKPSVFPVLNPKVAEITHITEEDLSRGLSFLEGINSLKEFVGEGDIICSWAKDDIAEIIKNSKYHGYEDLNWLSSYLDIQEYSTKILAHKKSLSLKNALDELKIKVDSNKLHDALNDAIYTSLVFKRLYNSRIVKNYIVKDIYDMPAMEVKELDSYEVDIEAIEAMCPKCKKRINIEYYPKLLNWRFVMLGVCPKCNGNVMNEIVIKSTLSGKEVYKEITTIVNEVEYLNYSYKLNKN